MSLPYYCHRVGDLIGTRYNAVEDSVDLAADVVLYVLVGAAGVVIAFASACCAGLKEPSVPSHRDMGLPKSYHGT